jgi:hypothetical protein
MMMNTCKNCNTTLVGRSDKKYCNDLCKSRFHNKAKNQNQTGVLYKKGMFTQMVSDTTQMESAIINEIQVAVRQYGYALTSIQIQKV